MSHKPVIRSLEDIQLLVDSFYAKVRVDPLLKDLFNNVIQDQWPVHLEKMYRFWQTVLLDEHTYQGSPFRPHANFAIDKSHFERWLLLFTETINEHFSGEKADEAKWRAQKMADMFLHKIQYFKTHPQRQIL